MAIADALSSLALSPLVEGACEAVGGRLGTGLASGVAALVLDRFRDHSQRLSRALAQAHARAWKALEIALAGDTFWERCQVRLARAEDQAFRAQVRAFLDATAGDQLPAEKADFRRCCLEELRRARKSGLLQPPAANGKPLAAFDESLQQLEDDRQLLARVADDLRAAGHVHLAQLVGPGDRSSLLATAVRYFFRRLVEADEELFQGLAFVRLEGLQERQEHGFEALHQLLGEQGDRVESLLDEVQAVVLETRAAVLDVQQELLEQGRQNRAVYQAVLDLQRRFDLLQAEVRPRDSLSIRSEGERRLVREVIAQYRRLPAEERERRPALLNAVGKLEVAAGAFEAAERDFTTVAALVHDAPARAEAHHNAYRAALERREWGSALRELRLALQLDPGRFVPFPLDRYEPECILGAGGTGVAFLCKDRAAPGRAVVKALLGDSLECGADQLFAEAGVLQRLDHPCIVRLRDYGFADPAGRTRPYLAMDHFDGRTLEEHVHRHGPLAPVEVTVLARQVAEALRRAHERNVLHRDVKPANLLVRATGGDLDVQLIDFGLALRQDSLRDSVRHTETLAGASIAGTLDYAAPEQMGKLPGTPAGKYSDVYGFGKTCCFALFGTPQPLLKHWQSVPAQLADLLGLCLAEKPAERPVDFGVVLRCLGHVEGTVGYGLAGDRAAPRGPKTPAEPPGAWEERRPPKAAPSRTPAFVADRPAPRRSHRSGIPPWFPGVLAAGGLLTVLGIVLLAVLLTRPSRTNPVAGGPPPPGAPPGNDTGWGPHPARPLPPELKPKENDPEDARVYLSDLEEFGVRPTPMLWRFGKKGHMGSPFQDLRVSFNGWVSEKGLSTHPTDKYGGVKYRIDPAETFETWVGISDSSGEGSRAPIVFKVLGDDKELWKSEPVSQMGRFQECRVSVRGVKVLELRACPPEGSVNAPHGGHAVWLDPYVTRPKPEKAEKTAP
jgi:serine/threonine protein kinase